MTHDFFHTLGGAERCTQVLANELLPEADCWVVGGEPNLVQKALHRNDVGSAFPLGKLSPALERALSPILYPILRFISRDKRNILASSYAFAHLRRTSGKKVIYCHSPFRQIYSGVDSYFSSNKLIQFILGYLLVPFRAVDRRAANEADAVIATNELVASRIRKYWGREPDTVISPPVDLELFKPVGAPSKDYYLWVGRVVEPYKKVSLLIDLFRDHPTLKLVIAGDGRDRPRLEAGAPDNVSFSGPVGGEELSQLYANAKALIFPSADDFGMAPIEAMACGTPVIAYGGGGARYTVVDGKTGILFESQSKDSISAALARFSTVHWDSSKIRLHTLQFGKDRFLDLFKTVMESL